MLVWLLRLIVLVLVLVKVRKLIRSILLENAVNYANPVVITFPVVHNKPIAGKICSSSSSLKCSSNFLTYYHNEYDDSNLANDLEIHLDKVSDAEYVESIKCTSHWNLS